jgi:choice-of-anchor B domain-containing protein
MTWSESVDEALCFGWIDAARRSLGVEYDEMGSPGGATTTYLFDMTSLAKPVALPPYKAATKATDHNTYILGSLAYQASYLAGIRVLDVSNFATGLKEVGFFDSSPNEDTADMDGAWTAYPYYKSGIVAMNTIDSGLYVLLPNRPAMLTQAAAEH